MFERRAYRAGWVFFAAVVALLGNDWGLKGAGIAPGWLTGKVSDFAGLVAAPVVLALGLRAIGVRRELAAGLACAAIGIGFSALKLSPAFAAGFDALVTAALRALALGLHSRTVVDASDLIALPMLGIAYRLAVRIELGRSLAMRAGVMCAALVCMGTSSPDTLVGPHWGFGGKEETQLRSFRHGVIELRLGQASLEGSFELGVAVYTHDVEVVLSARDITAWLDGQRVRARVGRGGSARLVVPAHGAGATYVYFPWAAPIDRDELRDFEPDLPDRDGHVVIPLQVGATTESFEFPRVVGPRRVEGAHGGGVWARVAGP